MAPELLHRGRPDASTRWSRPCSPASARARRAAPIDGRPHRHRHAPGRALGGDRRAGRAPPRRGRGRASTSPGREAGYPPTRHLDAFHLIAREQLPHHHPRRRGVRPAVHLGGAPVVRRRAARATACASSTTSRSSPTASVDAGPAGRATSATGACRSRCARPRTSTPAPCAPSSEHPIDLLRRLRFRVTVNTDNRLMSGISPVARVRDAARRVRLGPGRDSSGSRSTP